MHRAKLWAGAAMCAAQFLSGLCPSRVLAVNRSRPVRLITSRIFPVCPRKRTYLPILELLPPPTLRERRHRGLARRLVAVRRRAVFVMLELRASTSTRLPAQPHFHDMAQLPRALDRLDVVNAAAIPMKAEPTATRC